MKINEKWLREWVNPPISTEELCAQLTAAGLEVESCDPVAPPFTGVITAEIITAVPHPNANKLQVCTVNTGTEQLQIVCGAKNARPGIKVALATVGAVLPNGMSISKAKLRDVESFGMLCSETELGLAEQADGIWELPLTTQLGLDIRDCFALNDQIIDINITPNRGDCLSALGLAREIAIANQSTIPSPSQETITKISKNTLDVKVAANDACPRYLLRVIEGINIKAVLPREFTDKLSRAGIRSINPIVDILNYVMLEYGQPMHAFDRQTIKGQVHVRLATLNEKIKVLDGTEISLNDDILVIADSEKALAVAGIAGGFDSGVSNATENIVLESAFFTPEIMMGKARRLRQLTDSAYRFERGVDPEITRLAMERATVLINQYCAPQNIGEIVEIVQPSKLPIRSTIILRAKRLQRILGFAIESSLVDNILTRLSMEVTEIAEGWEVIAPSYRFDIAIESDLIEEIARVYGYDRIPTIAPQSSLEIQAPREQTRTLHSLKQILVDRGFYETLAYSFTDPKIQDLFFPKIDSISLQNPIASDLAVMRESLWINLVQSLIYNQQHSQERVRLFETGRVFYRENSAIAQPIKLAGLLQGSRFPEQWGHVNTPIDFYDLKAEVDALIPNMTCIADQHEALHPGQSARIEYEGVSIGWMGALHPRLMKILDIKNTVYLFELDLSKIVHIQLPRYQMLKKFPSMTRDLALVMKNEITFSTVYATVVASAGEHLVDITCLDDYRGTGIPAGQRSLLLRLTWQDKTKTLIAEEVNQLVESVLKALSSNLNVILRE